MVMLSWPQMVQDWCSCETSYHGLGREVGHKTGNFLKEN